jgi:hypothetical protein
MPLKGKCCETLAVRSAWAPDQAATINLKLELRRPRPRSIRVLDTWAAFLPIDIANEQIGDCIEDIRRRQCENGSRLGMCVSMISTIVWTRISSYGYFIETIGRRKSASENMSGRDYSTYSDDEIRFQYLNRRPLKLGPLNPITT